MKWKGQYLRNFSKKNNEMVWRRPCNVMIMFLGKQKNTITTFLLERLL